MVQAVSVPLKLIKGRKLMIKELAWSAACAERAVFLEELCLW